LKGGEGEKKSARRPRGLEGGGKGHLVSTVFLEEGDQTLRVARQKKKKEEEPVTISGKKKKAARQPTKGIVNRRAGKRVAWLWLQRQGVDNRKA